MLFVDFNVEILLKRSWRVFEEVISQALSFQNLIVFFIGVELNRVMELLVKLRVVAGDFDGEVSVLLRLLDFVEFLGGGLLKIFGVDLFNGSL